MDPRFWHRKIDEAGIQAINSFQAQRLSHLLSGTHQSWPCSKCDFQPGLFQESDLAFQPNLILKSPFAFQVAN
jgi:hypothetical protein